MDEIAMARLKAMRDPDYGVVAMARLHRERARLIRRLAELARTDAAIARCEARSLRAERPAPWFFYRDFPDRDFPDELPPEKSDAP